jgi:hypothetical protein
VSHFVFKGHGHYGIVKRDDGTNCHFNCYIKRRTGRVQQLTVDEGSDNVLEAICAHLVQRLLVEGHRDSVVGHYMTLFYNHRPPLRTLEQAIAQDVPGFSL